MNNTAKIYSALYIKHNIISGITVHCYYEDHVDYSIRDENLGHGNSKPIRIATYKEIGKILRKAGKELK